MSEQDNLNIVKREYDGLNAHNVDMTVQLVADTVKVTDVSYPDTLTKEGYRKSNQVFLTAFPDLHFDIKDMIAQGDKVAVSWEVHGTHNGPLEMPPAQTIPATHKSIHMVGSTFYELRNGLIVREDNFYDQVAFLSQIGLLNPEELLSRNHR
jgi:steroid delta-isomerase-like uncharacterized protein